MQDGSSPFPNLRFISFSGRRACVVRSVFFDGGRVYVIRQQDQRFSHILRHQNEFVVRSVHAVQNLIFLGGSRKDVLSGFPPYGDGFVSVTCSIGFSVTVFRLVIRWNKGMHSSVHYFGMDISGHTLSGIHPVPLVFFHRLRATTRLRWCPKSGIQPLNQVVSIGGLSLRKPLVDNRRFTYYGFPKKEMSRRGDSTILPSLPPYNGYGLSRISSSEFVTTDLLRARPKTLGEAFALARITEAHLRTRGGLPQSSPSKRIKHSGSLAGKKGDLTPITLSVAHHDHMEASHEKMLLVFEVHLEQKSQGCVKTRIPESRFFRQHLEDKVVPKE
ncbi:hypothetical protein Tco_0072807 [Tanacetum coccineum]